MTFSPCFYKRINSEIYFKQKLKAASVKMVADSVIYISDISEKVPIFA